MKREMAGKITSAVRGRVEKTEAVANELNATITVGQSEKREPPGTTAHTWDTTPEGCVHGRGDTNFPKHLELQIIANIQDATNERIFPCIELDAGRGVNMHCDARRKGYSPLDVREQFTHQSGTLIPILHLCLMHLFQDSRNKSI